MQSLFLNKHASQLLPNFLTFLTVSCNLFVSFSPSLTNLSVNAANHCLKILTVFTYPCFSFLKVSENRCANLPDSINKSQLWPSWQCLPILALTFLAESANHTYLKPFLEMSANPSSDLPDKVGQPYLSPSLQMSANSSSDLPDRVRKQQRTFFYNVSQS